MDEFYKSILNINNQNKTLEIEKIVREEVIKLRAETEDLTGFCKFIAYAIHDRLKENNITANIIDLTDIVGVNHTILITDTNPRTLIDPTFIQFTRKDNSILVGLEFWPSDKIDNDILNELLSNGYIEVDNKKFENYINSFSKEDMKINLEEIILNNKLNPKKI